MKTIESYQLEAVLAGETVTVDRLEYARELRRVASLHSGEPGIVEYDHADRPGEYRVRLTPGPTHTVEVPGVLNWAPSTPVTAPGAPPVYSGTETGRISGPCADCTQECAVYRVIPVDEVTLEFVFLKSRKFLGGPTDAEFSELTDEALAENPSLDYAEVVTTRDRKAFEASAGTRLVIPNRRSRIPARERMAKIRDLKGGEGV